MLHVSYGLQHNSALSVHCKNSIGILSIEYGYLSFTFDLSTPGTEQM